MIKSTSDFVFINESPTANAKDSANKKAIKAHAARFPRVADQQIQATTRSAARWNRYQKARRNRQPLLSVNLNVDALKPSSPQHRGTSTQTNVNLRVTTNDDSPSKDLSPVEELGSHTSSNDLIPRSMPGGGWASPFRPNVYHGKQFNPLLVTHYLSNLAINMPELDAGSPGLLRSRWFPMVITEDALYNVVLLTAASHYISSTPVPRAKIYLYCLKHDAITAVNRLILSNHDGIVDDQTIGAVAKMASYEAMFGEAALYHTHMKALVRLVGLRGGLGMLGLGGLLMRMVLWIDLNAAFLLKCPVYFRCGTPLAGHVALLEEPSPSHFLGAK